MANAFELHVGEFRRFEATLPDKAPAKTTAAWALEEQSGKKRPLGEGLSFGYVAPARLLNKDVTLSYKLTIPKAKPNSFKLKIVAQAPTTPPTKPVTAKVADGWSSDDKVHAASVGEGGPFFVGQRVRWGKDAKAARRGLLLFGDSAQTFFSPGDFTKPDLPALKHWVDVIACSTDVEGKSAFEALNTYDRASFTFGLIQFGAHTYNDNFHAFLRRAMLAYEEDAKNYFPELRVQGDDLEHRTSVEPERWVPLTQRSVADNAALRRFIKPDPLKVTVSEVLFAARMIHWTRAQKGLQTLMVEMAVERAKANLRDVSKEMDGKGIALCAAVFDIRLQGRGSNTQIRKALTSKEPLKALLAIKKGTPGETKRLDRLRQLIEDRLVTSPVKYHADKDELK